MFRATPPTFATRRADQCTFLNRVLFCFVVVSPSRYQHGDGVAQSIAAAVKWWRLAAEQGDAKAQWNLAAMYATGQGVARDMSKAMHWCKLAADQGNPDAQRQLQAFGR